MPRDRVVLTREDQESEQHAEVDRNFRRGLIYVGVGALFDIACAILIVAGMWTAGIVVGVVGLLTTLLAAREFGRTGRSASARHERGY